jgi:hypothetical protein
MVKVVDEVGNSSNILVTRLDVFAAVLVEGYPNIIYRVFIV